MALRLYISWCNEIILVPLMPIKICLEQPCTDTWLKYIVYIFAI